MNVQNHVCQVSNIDCDKNECGFTELYLFLKWCLENYLYILLYSI